MAQRSEDMSWSWYTGPLAGDHRCYHCQRPLRLHAGAGVVRWTDGQVYAVECLLDKESQYAPITECWKSEN